MTKIRAEATIQNLMGRFVQCLCAGKPEEAIELFMSDAVFSCPDISVSCQGRENVIAALKQYQSRLHDEGCYEIVMTHTPVLEVSSPKQGKGSWMATVFSLNDVTHTVTEGSSRFDVSFGKEDGRWKISSLVYYVFLTLLPEDLQEGSFVQFTLPHCENLVVEARIMRRVQQIMGRFVHCNRKEAMEYFCKETDPVLCFTNIMTQEAKGYRQVTSALKTLEELEDKNKGYFLNMMILTSPVITEDADLQTCHADYLAMVYDILGAAFGNEEADCPVVQRIMHVSVAFKNTEDLCITSLKSREILRLPDRKLRGEGMRRGIIGEEIKWLPVAEQSDLNGYMEQIQEIENLIGYWTGGIRYRSDAPFYYRFYALERPELCYYTPGVDKKNRGGYGLKDAARVMLSSSNKFNTYQPKIPGNHIGTSPLIEFTDEEHAVALWLDPGWTMIGPAIGREEKPFIADIGIARYELKCIRVDGKWKLYGFDWTPLFKVTEKWFDPAQTKGWCGTTSSKRWPLPLEDYHYEDNEEDRGKPIRLDPPCISHPREELVGLIVGPDI